MKQLLKICLIAISVMLLVQTPSFADVYYDIEHMDIQMKVSADNVYQVTETISVFFKEPRHGIFRNIPYRMYGYNHKITDIDVTDPATGMAYTTDIERSGGEVVIRIGDEDLYVQDRMVYRISYTFHAGADRNSDADEVYWNLIGPEWDAIISTADFRIEMPYALDEESVFFYDGYFGNESNDRVAWETKGKVIRAAISDSLLPNEGVSVKINLEEGYFSDVGEPFNTKILYGFLAAFVVAAFLAFRYRSAVSNKGRILPILSFYPPDGLNPPELAYVYKEESVSNSDLASLIVYWAANGCLHIKEETSVDLLIFKSSHLIFTKLKDLPSNAPQYERTLFSAFFRHGSGDQVTTKDLKDVFYQDLSKASGNIKSRFRDKREILENKYQSYVALTAFLLMVATTLSYGIFAYLINGWEGFWSACMGIGIAVIMLAFFFFLVQRMWKQMRKSIIRVFVSLLSAGLLVLFATIPAFLLLADTLPIMWTENPYALVLLFVLHVITYLQIIGTKVYSEYAITTVSQVLGFKEFIEKAKQEQLEMLFAQNPTYFYDILPYAMVLGLTGIWEKYVNTMTMEPPNWYDSHRGFHTGYLLSNINQTVTAATSTPSSSSSGGGSSGGGGGGGGGGSW